MKSKLNVVAGICLLALAGQAHADIAGSSGYQVGTYYANPHQDADAVSFDWDADTNLYYSTRNPYWDLGFAVYRHDGAALTTIYEDTGVFAGSRVTAIGNRIYFNDGGTYERWTYDYYRYDPAHPDVPTNMGIVSDLWGVETRDGDDFWSAGGMSAAIHYSALDAEGNLTSNPLVNLGAIGNASGPLGFDANGNLFYTEGYNTEGATVYRWTAAEVAAALANPASAPLVPAGHVLATLTTGDGTTGIVADDAGNPLITATSFTDPSELHRLLMVDGRCIGHEVLARSDERLETLRLRNGDIYVSSANGIFTITPASTLRLAAQTGNGGAVTILGINEQGRGLQLTTVTTATGQWVLRGLDGNRALLQAGAGGAVAIAEMNTAHVVTNLAIIAESVPAGWIARALDDTRILVQAGDGGLVGIQQIGPGYTLGQFAVVMAAVPGWIARDLAGNRLLAQAGDGGTVMIARLNAAGGVIGTTTVSEATPGRIARALCGNLLLTQDGLGGATVVMELDANDLPDGYRLALNPVPGTALIGLDIE